MGWVTALIESKSLVSYSFSRYMRAIREYPPLLVEDGHLREYPPLLVEDGHNLQ